MCLDINLVTGSNDIIQECFSKVFEKAQILIDIKK